MNKYIKYLFLPVIILVIYFFIQLGTDVEVFLSGNEMTFICVLILCFVIEYFIAKAICSWPLVSSSLQ